MFCIYFGTKVNKLKAIHEKKKQTTSSYQKYVLLIFINTII